MRKILFRGKATLTDDWVYGAYIRFLDVNGVPHDGIAEESCDEDAHLLSEIWAVDTETLSQYTGLDDRNEKMVFEGDILAGYQYPYTSTDGDRNYLAVVVWLEDSPAFGIATVKNPEANIIGVCDGNMDYMENWEPDDWKVIGNIYDNPELVDCEVCRD